MKVALGLLLLVTLVSSLVSCMKFEDFKKCSQSGFCRRNRAYADSNPSSPYTLVKDSVTAFSNKIHADIHNTETDIYLTLDLHILQDNTARVRINEKSPIKPRYEDHGKHTLVGEPKLVNDALETTNKGGIITVHMDKERKIVIHPSPVKIEFLVNNEPVITFNDRGFFNFEHLRTKEQHKPKMVEKKNDDGTVEMVEDESEKDLWEETFKTWTDPKPNGNDAYILYLAFCICLIDLLKHRP
jgi:alpha 1,3-glucosidase